jgi:hypothetical protein
MVPPIEGVARLVRRVTGGLPARSWIHGGAGFYRNTEVRLLAGYTDDGIRE